jgi:hypothetical protein
VTSVFGNPINFVPPVPANEHYVVARNLVPLPEVENIFQQIGTIFETQGFNLRFRDSPARSSVVFNVYPDAIIKNLQDPGKALVGEFKTP